uniref:Protein CASC3 n=1 Tax=Nyssomyia neivai TaxID=330878 RepID=A0A1L8DDK0_9DIPT
MESVAKPISMESSATRDTGSVEYVEDIGEQENCAESCQHDSEYNTASDSTTSDGGIEKISQKLEVIEISDEEENDDPDEEEDVDEDDEGSSIESGEEEEEGEGIPGQIVENKKQVDDDEDRSNPQYIPKRGTFYEHDDRTAENADAEAEEESLEGDVSEKKVSFNTPAPTAAKATKKWQNDRQGDRWSHDRYDESEQAPKSKAELVSAYGYDIRNEESPPRARRRRRYGRGPSKYTRKWEDENAYGKSQSRRIAINSKDEFPEIEDNATGRANRRRSEKGRSDEYEYYGRNQYGDNSEGQHYGRASYDNNQLKPKNQSFRVKSSIEFKNQNRMRQNAPEHNRQDSFTVSRNNNSVAVENNQESRIEHHSEERQQHHQVHSVNGNEFAEFVPTYMHTNQMEHQMHQMTQPNMLLQRDLPLTYTSTDTSVKMLPQRSGNAANLIPMGNDSMRQTPKRYSSLRQRSVMGNQMHPDEQERLKVSAPPVQKPQKYDAPEHHDIESPKLKMRQPKAHPLPQPPMLQQPATQQSSNFYPQEYIRQQQLPAHRPAPQAAAKNHATIPAPTYQPQFAANTTAPTFVPPPTQTTPAFIAPPPQPTNPPQILNYVPPPTMPTPPQYPPYPNYPNYNSLPTPSIPHQSQGGITYYAPQSQPPPRPVVAQRRPTNAIPILAPPERSGSGKGRGRLPMSSQQPDDGEQMGDVKSNVENIDHILDNMFTRRTTYEQPSLKAPSSPPVSPVAVKSEPLSVEQTEDALKNLSMSEQTDVKGIRSEESPSADIGQEDK